MAKKSIVKIVVDGVIGKKNESYDQEWLLEKIEAAGKSKGNAALVMFINSSGGSVYESDEVYEALKKYTAETERPVYAYFSSLAASGGYYIGCAAKKIFANRNTLTGSIGVIAGQFVDLTSLMSRHGVKAETIHAGKNKTMGHFNEPITYEHRQIMQSIADECYEQFVGIVAESRGLPLDKVKALADGRIYTARQAKENGLVDEIANFDDALKAIKKELFDDEDFDAKTKEFKLKVKGWRKFLRGAQSALSAANGVEAAGLEANVLSLAAGLVKPKVVFPAFFWEGAGIR